LRGLKKKVPIRRIILIEMAIRRILFEKKLLFQTGSLRVLNEKLKKIALLPGLFISLKTHPYLKKSNKANSLTKSLF